MFDEQFYEQLFDMLVSEGQIASSKNVEHDRKAFVSYFMEGSAWNSKEWRFCGDFGFGGKLYRNSRDQHVIGYYSEDRTKKLDNLANRLNRYITDLEVKFSPPENVKT